DETGPDWLRTPYDLGELRGIFRFFGLAIRFAQTRDYRDLISFLDVLDVDEDLLWLLPSELRVYIPISDSPQTRSQEFRRLGPDGFSSWIHDHNQDERPPRWFGMKKDSSIEDVEQVLKIYPRLAIEMFEGEILFGERSDIFESPRSLA